MLITTSCVLGASRTHTKLWMFMHPLSHQLNNCRPTHNEHTVTPGTVHYTYAYRAWRPPTTCRVQIPRKHRVIRNDAGHPPTTCREQMPRLQENDERKAPSRHQNHQAIIIVSTGNTFERQSGPRRDTTIS